MDYCGPHGIPHSVFLGRPVRPGDSQWLDTDRELALAWARNKAATCSSCGTRHDEWAEDRDAYVAAVHYCRGDDVLAMGREALPKDKDGRPKPGFFAYLQPREQWEAEQEELLARTTLTATDH